MNSISKTDVTPISSAKPQPAGKPEAPAGAKLDTDQLSLGRARGVEVEVVIDYLFFKRKVRFSLMPQPDGQMLFTQKDGDGKVRAQRTIGRTDEPSAMSLEVKVDVPFFSKALRVDLAHEDGVSRVKVTDEKSGRVLQEANSAAQ